MALPANDFPLEYSVDSLRVIVHADRETMGREAARLVAAEISRRQQEAGRVNVVFAAAPSQDEFLAYLADDRSIDWSLVYGFHMDEYLGLPDDHPASFRRYLREHLFSKVPIPSGHLRLLPGEDAERPLQTCLDYEAILRAEPPDIVCGGIGENGHLAFNDPPVADFLDPTLVKVVRLDAACRAQQVHDGGFPRLEDVPTHAYTLTIPALLTAPFVSLVVPGPRKVDAVHAALRGPVGEGCPASVLRRHPGSVLHLDAHSAAKVL